MIIFIYGSDTFRSRQKLKEIKNKFIQDVSMGLTGLDIMNGEILNIEKFHEKSASNSLFTKKRMIVIENVFANKNKLIFKQLFDFLKNIKTDNIFVFWDEHSGEKLGRNKLFNFLSQQNFVQNFQTLSGNQLHNWIKKEITNAKCSASSQTISLLAAYFGSNLWQLTNEINKLANYTKKNSQDNIVTKKIVEKLSRGKIDTNIFALTDAISNNDKKTALNLFDKEIDAGTSSAYLLHMITRQFKILLELKDGEEKGYSIHKIKKDFKMHPFVVQKGLMQTKKFSIQKLKSIFNSLIRIDQSIKQGKTNPKTALSILISRI